MYLISLLVQLFPLLQNLEFTCFLLWQKVCCNLAESNLPFSQSEGGGDNHGHEHPTIQGIGVIQTKGGSIHHQTYIWYPNTFLWKLWKSEKLCLFPTWKTIQHTPQCVAALHHRVCKYMLLNTSWDHSLYRATAGQKHSWTKKHKQMFMHLLADFHACQNYAANSIATSHQNFPRWELLWQLRWRSVLLRWLGLFLLHEGNLASQHTWWKLHLHDHKKVQNYPQYLTFLCLLEMSWTTAFQKFHNSVLAQLQWSLPK